MEPSMSYRQITSEERYKLSALRVQGLSNTQIAERLGRHRSTIWREFRRGGDLHRYLRCAVKRRRKRYGSYDSRGRLVGKRMIGDRPEHVNTRRHLSHWEIDTVMGKGDRHCIVTLVERKSGYTLIGKLTSRTKEQAPAGTVELIHKHRSSF
jgi:transposase, IS30 family